MLYLRQAGTVITAQTAEDEDKYFSHQVLSFRQLNADFVVVALLWLLKLRATTFKTKNFPTRYILDLLRARQEKEAQQITVPTLPPCGRSSIWRKCSGL